MEDLRVAAGLGFTRLLRIAADVSRVTLPEWQKAYWNQWRMQIAFKPFPSLDLAVNAPFLL